MDRRTAQIQIKQLLYVQFVLALNCLLRFYFGLQCFALVSPSNYLEKKIRNFVKVTQKISFKTYFHSWPYLPSGSTLFASRSPILDIRTCIRQTDLFKFRTSMVRVSVNTQGEYSI